MSFNHSIRFLMSNRFFSSERRIRNFFDNRRSYAKSCLVMTFRGSPLLPWRLLNLDNLDNARVLAIIHNSLKSIGLRNTPISCFFYIRLWKLLKFIHVFYTNTFRRCGISKNEIVFGKHTILSVKLQFLRFYLPSPVEIPLHQL